MWKFYFDGEDGEKTTIDVKDLKEGKVNIGVEDKEGEESGINIESDEDGNTTMEMDTEDGTFESKSGEGTELPDGFPKDFPLPQSAELISSTTMTEGEIISYSVAFMFKEDPEEVYSQVKEYAENNNLEINMENKSDMDGSKSYMLGAGESGGESSEYFLFNIVVDDETMGSIMYGVPNK